MQHCILNSEVALRVGSIACRTLDTVLQECDEWDSSHLEVLDATSKASAVKSPLSWPLMCHSISTMKKKKRRKILKEKEEERLIQVTFRCSMAFCSSWAAC